MYNKKLYKKIAEILDINYNSNYSISDLNNIYFMLVGKFEFDFSKINDNEIDYIIITYFDNAY